MGTGRKSQNGVLCTYRTSMSTGRIESALAALSAERQLLEQRLQALDEEIDEEDMKAKSLRYQGQRRRKGNTKAARHTTKKH